MGASYCPSLTEYKRRISSVVDIGGIPMGGEYPIRIQSMTTTDTMDTIGSIDQIVRMVDSGCDYVRLTAPSIKQAKNLKRIKDGLLQIGVKVPIIADIHFTPKAAEVAAGIIEKVRINPGNYADRKNFQSIEYSDGEYQVELERIRDKFLPLLTICKERGTAMRIGTNHGSLSDRILSRYGDTPLGMVESALEFLRIADDENYHNIVLSMKASNPQVMIQAYRLLVNRMDSEGLQPYPLHLGVTEAGEGEDGRIKSALGIGTLLEDGLGDTVRVSLTEAPEEEAPVAKMLVDRYDSRGNHSEIFPMKILPYDPFKYSKRATRAIMNIGADNVPRVVADYRHLDNLDIKELKATGHFYLPEPDKWAMNDQGVDYVYSGSHPMNFMPPNGLREILDYSTWIKNSKVHTYPIFEIEEFKNAEHYDEELNFLKLDASVLDLALFQVVDERNVVGVLESKNSHTQSEIRRFFSFLIEHELSFPVILFGDASILNQEEARLYLSTDFGGLFTDGMGDGLWIKGNDNASLNSLAFGILQASRTRISKTEYISCPSCGRTLFDLQETTAMIRNRTDHLKGLKIGIMGCIVNGPGEMADADYGYVGSGVGKITLYRKQEVVKRGVASVEAVDELIEIIKSDNNWIEP